MPIAWCPLIHFQLRYYSHTPSSRNAIELSDEPKFACLFSFLVWSDVFTNSGSVYDRVIHVHQGKSHEGSLVHSVPTPSSCLSSLPLPPIQRPSYPRRNLDGAKPIDASISCGGEGPPSSCFPTNSAPPRRDMIQRLHHRVLFLVAYPTHGSPLQQQFQRETWITQSSKNIFQPSLYSIQSKFLPPPFLIMICLSTLVSHLLICSVTSRLP